jgi:tRNA1(Val) A37 N6-methylase TrmN6
LAPSADEDLSFLCGDWRIFQKRKGHRWSLDDLVTAWVATQHRPHVVEALDLGCGLGSVLLLCAFKWPSARVMGLEAQGDRADMARRSIDFNGVAERCRVLTGDLREHDFGGRTYEMITGTPPYFPPGTGTESTHTHAAPCRFEHRGGVEAYLQTAAKLLTPAGQFVMCASALERSRIRAAASDVGLALVSHLEVIPLQGKAALLTVDVFSRLPAESPTLSTLTVRDANHQWSAQFSAVRSDMGLPPTAP